MDRRERKVAGRARSALGFRPALLLVACQLHLVVWADVVAAQGCEAWLAKLVSVQGTVEARRAGDPRWSPVRLDELFCSGDSIQVGERGRAAILLRTGGVFRLNQNTTISFPEPEEATVSLVSILRGVAHFLSRAPRMLKVSTPFVDGGVEGTEFLVEVAADRTTLTVFEGRVTATNDAGRLVVSSGQSATAVKGGAPVARAVVRPRDAVEWALYYPPVIDYRPADFPAPGWQELVRRSIQAYWDGDLSAALTSLQGAPADVRDPRFFTYRAALLLTVGRVDEAGPDLERALALDAKHAPAVAVQSVVAVVQNEKAEALRLGRRAVELGPESPVAWIALSYAQQADFDLKAALVSVERAVKLEPTNSLAWARLSELRLSLGRLGKALDAAKTAVKLNPRLARTQVVLGFAHVTQIKVNEAKRAFEAAIRLDSGEPLARLGLALATIRGGDLPAGEREIEIAASLDPNRSLVRSYLGKAYYEERRGTPAKEEFSTAKKLDPNDPTPFLYDAIQKESENRLVEAFRDLQTSIELNDNRAVYRSQLLLDEDRAVRSSSLGRIYDELGFQQRALVEGWKSVNIDPADYSAHRFLADSYAVLPRHEIARVSELLQAQLLQPINISPFQPQLALSQLSILSGTGLTNPSFNEYFTLFERNRAFLLLSGFGGSNGTVGDEAVHSAVMGPFAYSLGQFHYRTDGFRTNNDLTHDVFDVFGQLSLSHATSVQVERRAANFERGDLPLRFDPDNFNPDIRQKDETTSTRLGLRHAFAPNSVAIVNLRYDTGRFTSDPFPDLVLDTDATSYVAEAQHLFRSERFRNVAGVGYVATDREDTQAFEGFVFFRDKRTIEHTNVYDYLQIRYPDSVTWTLGLSADFLEKGLVDREQLNPKLGVIWTPFPGTTVRAAGFRTVKRELISDQTIEPTQVAGFNQFFDDGNATSAWRYGAGIDQKIGDQILAGVEWSERKLDVPFVKTILLTTTIEESKWFEQVARAYLYWMPHSWLALSGEYQYEEFERPSENVGGELITYLQTHRVPVGVRIFFPVGITTSVKATFVDQEGEFVNPLARTLARGDDQFVVVDAGLSYRLPKRFGLLSIEARNLFDERFKFQDTDPATPSIYPERFIFARLTLAF